MDWSWIGVVEYSAMDCAVVFAVEHKDRVLSAARMILVMSSAPPKRLARATMVNHGRSRSVCLAPFHFSGNMFDFVFSFYFLAFGERAWWLDRVIQGGWDRMRRWRNNGKGRERSTNMKHVGLGIARLIVESSLLLLSNLLIFLKILTGQISWLFL